MEDKFIRYSKLYALIFLLFLSVPVIIGLIMATFYGFSKLVSMGRAEIVFEILILAMPVAIFATVYSIFMIRTKRHPSGIVRIISWFFLSAGLYISFAILVTDMISFFTNGHIEITEYKCFETKFLAGNIAGLFLVAILQAFTTKKEVDWMERRGEGVDG